MVCMTNEGFWLSVSAVLLLCAGRVVGGEMTSIEELCKTCPERVTRLFERLDLDRAGMASVKQAVGRRDSPAACRALLAHYRKGASAQRPSTKPGTKRRADADAILNDTITCYRLTAKVPRRPDGGLDWCYNGPNNDREWGWGLNRHYHLSALLNAYEQTGNPIYVRCLDRHLSDWVRSNPYPAAKSRTPQWRGLEAHCRVLVWARVFARLQSVDAFSPATRILMLSSIPEHAHYLRHFHAGGGNWITMEMFGLATAAATWPEFKDAAEWSDYATRRILPEMLKQVYPDGVQKELTSHYHRVALGSFQRFADLGRRSNRPVPAEFTEGLERMWNYTAYSLRPDGHGPLNNDSNRDHNAAPVVEAAKTYGRPDWVYIATQGRRGTRPERGPSVVFPYAGQVIMRSGWDADAHWAFFDVGPLGIGHWHLDKLHLSVAAYGRDLLVDAGRYTYKGGRFRSYFVGSASHNVILVDGKPQAREKPAVAEPMSGNYLISPTFDFARGVFGKGFAKCPGKAVHTRAVVYVRGGYWVVVDRIDTDRPRTIQPLWHFHPECTVAADGNAVVTTDPGKGNLRLLPVSDLDWKLEMVKGRTEPDVQGWYSPCYNLKVPSTTCVYTAKISGPTTFAWVIVPAKGSVPEVSVKTASIDKQAVRLQVGMPGAAPQRITVPLSGNNAAVEAIAD